MSHDSHVRQVRRLTDLINRSPDPEVREEASDTLADKWKTYNRNKGGK